MTYLLRITYANFLYALWLRLRGPVAAWRIELPPVLARPFRLLRPYELFTRDEWILLHDAGLDAWRERIMPAVMRDHRCLSRLAGIEVDFSRNVWQILALEFERLYLFVATVRRNAGTPAPTIIPPWITFALGYSLLRTEFPHVGFRRSRLNEWGERLYEWGLSGAHIARTVLQFVRSLVRRRIVTGPRRILWTGISPQEIPGEPGKLHFGWAVAYGHVAPQEVLYFPPCPLNARQASFLANQSIASVAPNDVFRLLPFAERVRAIVHGIRGAVRGLCLDSATVGPLRARFMARAPLWQALAREVCSGIYMTSTSSSWPERPEVASLQAAGLKTVIWSYSANTLWFANAARNFRDASIIRSIVISDEFWVWNEAVRRYYERRRATDALPIPRLEVTGPMMCGDVACFDLPPQEARRRLGLPAHGFYIAIFDVPTVDDAWRQRFGGGPVTIEPEFGEAFFAGIRDMLDAHPEVNLILKLKRRIGERYRPLPSTLYELIAPAGRWMQNGRIGMVDVNCDPYLPIAAGDASLGMPFTSPILAALASGRPAAYFDPLRLVGYSPEPGLCALALQSQTALHAALARWIEHSFPQPVAPDALVQRPVWRDQPRLFSSSRD